MIKWRTSIRNCNSLAFCLKWQNSKVITWRSSIRNCNSLQLFPIPHQVVFPPRPSPNWFVPPERNCKWSEKAPYHFCLNCSASIWNFLTSCYLIHWGSPYCLASHPLVLTLNRDSHLPGRQWLWWRKEVWGFKFSKESRVLSIWKFQSRFILSDDDHLAWGAIVHPNTVIIHLWVLYLAPFSI